jgi:hypothetical protein
LPRSARLWPVGTSPGRTPSSPGDEARAAYTDRASRPEGSGGISAAAQGLPTRGRMGAADRMPRRGRPGISTANTDFSDFADSRISRKSQLLLRCKSEKSAKSVFAVLCGASIAPAELEPSPGRRSPRSVPKVSPKEMNRARRDGGSLPRCSLRRARSARRRPSASGLYERSAADEADAAVAEPWRRRARPGCRKPCGYLLTLRLS